MVPFRTIQRLGLSAAALVLALLAVVEFAAWRGEQARLAELWAASGLAERYPQIGREVRRDTDPELARLRLARALFASELDRTRLAGLDEAERGLRRLALARELAAETLPRRPASWRGAFVLGGATYLELARQRDPRLGSTPALWEGPLVAAHHLSPGHAEPVRFLAAAYLGNWTRLSDDQQAAAREIVRQAFRDPETFDLLIETWLRVAPSLADALAVVPPEPQAWDRLKAFFSRVGDVERFRDAHLRWFETMPDLLATRLEAAEARLRAGAETAAIEHFAFLGSPQPNRRFAPFVRAALAGIPRAKLRPDQARRFTAWLDWALDLCVIRDCPLPPASLERLTELATDLPPHRNALASLAAGNLALAEIYERRAAATGSEEWGPYLLLKARRLIAAGRGQRAADSLERIHAGWRSTPAYWRTRLDLALRRDSEAATDEARRELDRLAATEWSPAEWTVDQQRARLVLLPSAPGGGLSVEIGGLAPEGCAVEARLDGGVVDFFVATPGDRLSLDVEVDATPHLLELVWLWGRAPSPGRVTLTPA